MVLQMKKKNDDADDAADNGGDDDGSLKNIATRRWSTSG